MKPLSLMLMVIALAGLMLLTPGEARARGYGYRGHGYRGYGYRQSPRAHYHGRGYYAGPRVGWGVTIGSGWYWYPAPVYPYPYAYPYPYPNPYVPPVIVQTPPTSPSPTSARCC